MLKDKNNIKKSKTKKDKINDIIKRVRGSKNIKNFRTKKFIRFKKKIYFRKKKKRELLCSEGKTIFSESSSFAETNDACNDYKNELMKIITNIKSKYKIEDNNLYENNLINKINDIILQTKRNKVNIILDIDQTLIYSQRVNEGENKISNLNETSIDNHYIEFYLENKKYLFHIQVRKGLKQFLSKLSPYCNFYVNTMANPIYIRAVLTLLNQKYNLNLINNGLNNVFITTQNEKKTLPPEITKDGNFLILDDNICAWDKSYLSNIIPVRKFYGLFNEKNFYKFTNDAIYQYYLFTNKIYCFNELQRQFYDYNNKLPFCSEASWSELNQLDYISDLIIKCYLISKLLNIQIFFAFYNILHNILSGCKIYYDGEDKSFFQELILLLGGNYVFDINEASHILIKDNNIKNEILLKNNNYNFINIKWLFDTFFCFIKFDEEKYKL